MRFGTSPVKNAYWQEMKSQQAKSHLAVKFAGNGKMDVDYVNPPEIKQDFDKLLLSNCSPTVAFKRFESLSVPGLGLDVMARVFVGVDDLDYRTGNGRILNDAWTVSLRSTDDYKKKKLQEFELEIDKHLENHREGNMVFGINVAEELKDLLKVYTESETYLKQKEETALESHTYAMKRYLDASEERKVVSNKLKTLVAKLSNKDQGCECGECDDEQDEDDE